MNLAKKKYLVVFTVKEQEVHTVISRKKVRPTDKTVRFRKKTFPIDMNFPTYQRGLRLFFFVDINDGQVLLNETSKESIINPEMIDAIMSQKIVSQLTTNLSGNAMKMSILAIIMGALIGTPIGIIIGGYI